MDAKMIEHLKKLETNAIDARNGYEEALKDADGKGMSLLFKEMLELHARHADEIAAEIPKAQSQVDPAGSIMSTVHKTIMDIRSLFDGLDASVLPGLIDGERRNLAAYDEALAVERLPLLTAQRERLLVKISEMAAQEAIASR